MQGVAERRDGGAGGAVPVHAVLLKTIVGREIESAAEPPDIAGAKEADACMARGHVGIPRMDHERDAERLPCLASDFWAVCGGGCGKFGAAHMRKRGATLFKHRPARDNARATATAPGSLPLVSAKLRAT